MKPKGIEVLEKGGRQAEPADDREDRNADLQAARMLVVQIAAVQRLLRIYRPNNAAVSQAADSLMETIGGFFREMPTVEIRFWRDCVFVCGDRLRCDVSNFAAYKSLLAETGRLEIEKMEFTSGIDRDEVIDFFKLMDALDSEHTKAGDVADRIAGEGFKHIAIVPSARSQELEGLGLATPTNQERAKRAFYAALGSAKEALITQTSQGAVSLRKAKRAVHAAVDALLEDETSVLALATIKDHDEYTFTHSVNVCIFSLAIGQRLGLHRNWLGRLGMSALFHDIGKTSVPTGVLNKVGVLDVDEWKAIRQHTLMGVKSLCKLPKSSEHMIHSMIVAFQHHINLDLTGYPDVASDTSLDLFSRIVRIADTFDAMTTERPYRNKVYSPHEAIRYLISQAGIKFDPVLVKAFASAMGIYPIGTVLRLDTNDVGIVVKRSELSGEPDRAMIRVILNSKGEQVPGEVFIDLGEVDPDTGEFVYQVTETLSCKELGVNPRNYLIP
jgi:HD-GYP domain-containing protein (c-di-GMP phosphodiesterase class II)